MDPSKVDSTVLIIARVHTSRPVGAKMCFINLRQRLDTIQAILTVDESNISKQMLKYANSIPDESLVLVRAKVVKSMVLVTGCSIQDVELAILELHTISEAARLPFSIEDASRPEEELAIVYFFYSLMHS
jgi:aspartyl-tRNA synthetase